MKKDDSGIRIMMEDIVNEMKDELLKSVIGKIEIQEGCLLEKQQENDKLRTEIDYFKERTENTKQENVQLPREKMRKQNLEEKINDLEQYSRRNKIRISGVRVKENETIEETATSIVQTLNAEMPVIDLYAGDIDIAHRLGKADIEKVDRSLSS